LTIFVAELHFSVVGIVALRLCCL